MQKIEKILQENKIKLFIFDFDGTIMDTVAAHYLAWCETFKFFGKVFISEEEFNKKFSGTSSEELIRILNKTYFFQLEIDTAITIKNKLFREKYFEKITPFPKTIEIIKNYFGMLPLVIASGGEKDDIKRILNMHNLAGYFVDIIAISDVEKGKPEPDLFLLAAKNQNIASSHCLVFEDSETGIQAAKNANMKFINIKNVY